MECELGPYIRSFRDIQVACHLINTAQAVAQPLPFREIRFGSKKAPGTDPVLTSHLESLKSLVAVSKSKPVLLKETRTMVLFQSQSSLDAAGQTTALLCHLLSGIALRHFSINLLFGSTWMPYLSLGSAKTLTHLDICIHAVIVLPSFIEGLNSLWNLTFLRILDELEISYHDFNKPYPSSLTSLPQLSLPRLQEMQLIVRPMAFDRSHPDGHIPFYLGATASLPAIRSLLLYESHSRREVLRSFLLAFGKSLQRLSVTLRSMDELKNIHEYAPGLIELWCYGDSTVSGFLLSMEHPLIERLLCSGLDGLSASDAMRCIDPGNFPRLRHIRMVEFSWDSVLDSTSFTEIGRNQMLQLLNTAVVLAALGIPYLDRDGKPFGNLIQTCTSVSENGVVADTF